jgi:hypothetical protein
LLCTLVTGSTWLHSQGPDTDRRAVAEIREAVKTGTETSVRLLNYKKNGQPFWNLFTLAPMADVDGNLRFIIGVQACTDLGVICSRHSSAVTCLWIVLQQLSCYVHEMSCSTHGGSVAHAVTHER